MLPLKIAWQFIIKSPIQTFFTVLTITIGIGIQFFILSIGNTLSNVILENAAYYNEHIMVRGKDNTLTPPPRDLELLAKIREEVPEIEIINSLYYMLNVTLSSDTVNELPFAVRGVDDDKGLEFYGLKDEKFLISGELPTERYQILLTQQFAEKYLINPGDWITLKYYLVDAPPISINYQVTGIYDLGLFRISYAFAVIKFEDLPELFQDVDALIVAQITDPRNASKVAEKIKPYFDEELYEVVTWKDLSPEIHQLDFAQVLVIGLIQVFISFAIFIVVSSILGFSVHQKSKQLGILKALGLQDNNISSVFLLQSILQGFLGMIFGLIGGTIFINIYQEVMRYEDGSYRVVFQYPWYNYLISVGLIAATVLLSALISIRRAKKVSIIELIKT